MTFCATSSPLTRMCRAWYSTSGVDASCVSYSARSLRLGGRAVLQVLLRRGLLDQVQARQLEARGDLGFLGEPVLLGLLRDQFDADQVFLDLLAVLGRELAGGFALGDGLDIVLEHLLADGLAVDRDQRRLGGRGRGVGGLVGGGGLGAGGERQRPRPGRKNE